MSASAIYWRGNAAKAFVIREVLAEAAGSPVTVLDHGCGDGGGWPEVLKDNPNVRLVGWDLNPSSAEAATAALRGLNAEITSGRFPAVRADVVVSFSVFEHVLDRHEYMAQARSVLERGGVFWLNYDDGHFRTVFDPDEGAHAWIAQGRTLLHNILARRRSARLRVVDHQRRITAHEAVSEANAASFEVEDSWYHNVEAFKWLVKHVDSSMTNAFMEFWLEVEERLNEQFSPELVDPIRGDRAALWQIAASRTLRLRAR